MLTSQKAAQTERLYVLETPYIRLFNLDREAVAQHKCFAAQHPPTYQETIRPMTEDEIHLHAD